MDLNCINNHNYIIHYMLNIFYKDRIKLFYSNT
jgi:hypothetical protein